MSISKRETNLALITLIALLAGGTWWLVDSKLPIWRGMQDEIEITQNKIRSNKTAIEMQNKWMGELKNLQSGLRVFDSADTSVAPDLMKVVSKIADKHDFLITSQRPQNEKKMGELFELGINCSWEATLEAAVHFLAALQEEGVNYDVRSLDMRPGRNVKEKNKLSGTMMIHFAYTRRPNPKNK